MLDTDNWEIKVSLPVFVLRKTMAARGVNSHNWNFKTSINSLATLQWFQNCLMNRFVKEAISDTFVVLCYNNLGSTYYSADCSFVICKFPEEIKI